MTQPHSGQFGRNVWSWRHDQSLEGHQERRRGAGHGSQPGRNHPCGFKWALEARDNRGATLVTVDPRYNPTSAVADRHLQIRPGSDIAVLGGWINKILTEGLFHEEYVRLHTNASFVVAEGFGFDNGLFAGFDEATGAYDRSAWDYERAGDGFVRRDPDAAAPTLRLSAPHEPLQPLHARSGGPNRRLFRG